MKVSEVNFRQVYHRICFIEAGKNYDFITEALPDHEKGNGTLVYGYVDHEAGLTFEILACALRDGEGNITSFRSNDSVTLKYRAGHVSEDELFIIEDDTELMDLFQEKIKMVNDGYQVDDGIEATRNIEEIDGSRNHDFPDDILVILIHEGNNPEGCWVRCKTIEDGMLIGELLNEPDSDFKVHQGDMIPFGIMEQDDDVMCVAPL